MKKKRNYWEKFSPKTLAIELKSKVKIFVKHVRGTPQTLNSGSFLREGDSGDL